MVFSAFAFSALLHALSLTQGSYKPTPLSFNVAGNFTNPVPLHRTPHEAQVFFETTKISPPVDNTQDPCYVDPYDAPPIEKQDFPPFDPKLAKIYRYRQQMAVNLGSWFVQESWMTPSLFQCASGNKISELDIASGWGSTTSSRSMLERHWDTFITKADFEYLSSIGINTVRLPIGYWNLGPSFCKNTPFEDFADVYENSWPRIVRAINEAGEHGIGVLVDLHGAVGSQNGQPHSGISDGQSNMFTNTEYMEMTLAVLEHLVQQLAFVTNVVGIQLLNEPKNTDDLPQVYTEMIDTMRDAVPDSNSFPLYIHDGFVLTRFDEFVSNRSDFVVQDHHSYFVFTPADQNEPASQHTGDVRGPISQSFADASSKERRNLIIGEWSCALTSESISHETDQDKARRDFGEGQMDVYSSTAAGWSFWSYLKEDCENDPGWCFKAAVDKSLPATFFAYKHTPKDADHAHELSSRIAHLSPPSASEILSSQANGTAPDSSQTGTQDTSQQGLQRRQRRVQNRFHAIHRRHINTDDAPPPLTPAQQSTVKGYTNGFLAALEFGSKFQKVGFIGQYMADNWPEGIEPGMEQNYRDGYGQGLMAGQGRVQMVLSEDQDR